MATVGAVLLAVSLFLDWFKADREESGLSGWTVFEVLDLVLAGLALAALVAAVNRLGYRVPGAPRSLVPLGLVAVVVVGSQLLNHPPAGVDRSPEVGIWLALGAAVLILLGGVIGRARISFEFVKDRPAAEPPAATTPPPATTPRPTSTPAGEDDTTRVV